MTKHRPTTLARWITYANRLTSTNWSDASTPCCSTRALCARMATCPQWKAFARRIASARPAERSRSAVAAEMQPAIRPTNNSQNKRSALLSNQRSDQCLQFHGQFRPPKLIVQTKNSLLVRSFALVWIILTRIFCSTFELTSVQRGIRGGKTYQLRSSAHFTDRLRLPPRNQSCDRKTTYSWRELPRPNQWLLPNQGP